MECIKLLNELLYTLTVSRTERQQFIVNISSRRTFLPALFLNRLRIIKVALDKVSLVFLIHIWLFWSRFYVRLYPSKKNVISLRSHYASKNVFAVGKLLKLLLQHHFSNIKQFLWLTKDLLQLNFVFTVMYFYALDLNMMYIFKP